MNTPDCQKERRLCHINMLKPYCEKGQVEVPVTIVAACADTQQRKRPHQQEEVRKSPRLRNSDALLNLEQKLQHLPEQEKMMIKE